MLELIQAFEIITTAEWLRLALLYTHLVLCVFAISAVLKTDFALFFGKVSREELEATAKSISVILLFLWATGLSIIYIDTGFSPAELMTKSKLLLKLMSVVTLTLNGMVLHHISFPVLTKPANSMTKSQSVLLVVTGALSTSHWLLAAFVGTSKPLGKLPVSTLLNAYGVFVFLVVISSLLFIPLLSRINTLPASKSQVSNGIEHISL